LDESELKPGAASDSGGAAGDLNVYVTGGLDLRGGGEITAATQTSGKGGDLTVNAGSVDIDGASSAVAVASSAKSNAGAAGDISIFSKELTLDNGGAVSASAGDSSGGNITIGVQGDMNMSGGTIEAAAEGNGGNITIAAGFLSLQRGSQFSANAVQGMGGTLTFNFPLDAVLGQTSGFYLVGQDIFQSADSTITATSDTGIPGRLLSNAPHEDLANSLVALSGAIVGSNIRLEETCAMAVQGNFSSFLEIGQGDIEAGPDEAQGETGETPVRHPINAGHEKAGQPQVRGL
jgi:hypothetical protein